MQHFLWNSPHVNGTKPHWCVVSIDFVKWKDTGLNIVKNLHLPDFKNVFIFQIDYIWFVRKLFQYPLDHLWPISQRKRTQVWLNHHCGLDNTLRPRQNGPHFPDDIFKWIFLNENVWIPIEISLKFLPKGPINNIPALVQIMAWRRPDDKPLSETMMVSSPTHICVYMRRSASMS